MKSFLIPLFICVLGIQIGVSQTSLNDYHYVVVPDQFEFLRGKDQFQVNSLTVWLLNKNGFNAYLDSQLPLSLRKKPCKGLKAVVVTKENFIAFKANIVFTDCMGAVVYTSDEGRSKDKDYRKAYHEAVRKAFESITALNVTQLPLDTLDEDSDPVVSVIQDDSGGISSGGAPAVTAVITEVKDTTDGITSDETPNTVQSESTAMVAINEVTKEVPTATTMQFKEYTLVPNQKNFDILYKGTLIGAAKPTANAGVYLVTTDQFSGVGYPTDDGFVIEREIEGMDQNIKMIFIRK